MKQSSVTVVEIQFRLLSCASLRANNCHRDVDALLISGYGGIQYSSAKKCRKKLFYVARLVCRGWLKEKYDERKKLKIETD